MRIHFNLGVAVGCANLIFLTIEPASKSTSICVMVTILLYYFNMSVLSWMLIEGRLCIILRASFFELYIRVLMVVIAYLGLYLYFQVVVVFISARRWVRHFIVAGWAVPGIITIVAMGILNIQLKTNQT